MSKETIMTTDVLTAGKTGAGSSKRLGLLAGLAAAACALLVALSPGSAAAAVTCQPGQAFCASIEQTFTNQNGTPDTQAGSTPYEATTTLSFSTTSSGLPTQNVKDVTVNLPAGVVGNPNATPKCTIVELDGHDCLGASQIGVMHLNVFENGTPSAMSVPLYNLVPPTGMPAQFGANILNEVNTFLDVSVRTGTTPVSPSARAGDYGITTTSSDISADLPVAGISVTLWGVPADPSHDADRTCPGNTTPCSANTPLTPFLAMPTTCSGPLTTTLQTDAWQSAGDFASASSSTADTGGNPVGITGCEALSFNPSISVQPDTTSPSSPAGVNVDLHIPQAPEVPTALATAMLQSAVVTLPSGMALNPAAAGGLQACSETQFGYGNAAEPACPQASTIGSVEIDSPLLPDPLVGSIYVAQQDANPFGSTYAIYVAGQADGVLVKLAGEIQANPVTGQLTTTFDNNPQLPFTDFKLDFFGGPRAALETPASCGTFTTTSSLTPSSAPDTGAPATPSSSFSISGCAGDPFTPTFTAGTTNPQAGAYSPLLLSMQRSDTDQNFQGLSVQLPPGMLAKLAGVQECSDAQLAQAATESGAAEQTSPSCPAGSQVGTVTTGAGVGPDPYYIQGKAYLTGPYKGAPYGIAVVVPAVAGPYDLGTVVVRQALYIDPTTAQVTDVSDSFPTMLDGVPLDISRIDVDLNRPDFTVNPTSCNPMAVTGTLSSTAGLSEPVSSRFQVGGCQDIGFSPKLKIGLSGKGQTKSGDHPALTATLTQGRGQANIHSAKVTLPLSMALDPNNSNHVCSYAVAAAVHGGPVGCPTKTIVGTATANTPLLSQPLTGKVYLVQGLRCAKGSISAQGTCANGKTAIHTLPSLLVPLRGQIALDLRAKSSVNGAGALVTTFSTIPDAPVSKFTLQITGGKKGLLVVTGRGLNICAKKQVGDADFGAQSGKTMTGSMTLSTPCAGVKHKTKQHSSNRTTKSRRAGLVVDRRLS